MKKALQALEKQVVTAHIEAARGPLKAWVQARHGEAETGGSFDDFAGVVTRRSAVQFLLRTLYVRVLEDLGVLTPLRLRGDAGFEAFRAVAASQGKRADLGWVFRDLRVEFPDLFTPAADELPLPDEARCEAAWASTASPTTSPRRWPASSAASWPRRCARRAPQAEEPAIEVAELDRCAEPTQEDLEAPA